MNIIWGYKADPHITAQQLRNTYIGIFGDGTHILGVGSNLAATVVSATEVQIADGVMIAQGCTASIENGVTESLVISNGTQGMLRKDLIVAQYTKASGTGVESMGLAVKTGTPAASNPATPSYTTGSIADGDTLVEFPLYQVNLDGITITSIERLVDVVNIPSAQFVSTMRQRNIAAGYANAEKSLTVDFGIVPIGVSTVVGSSFEAMSDGGYRAVRSGTVLVSASCNVSNVVGGDVVQACIGRYRGGWVYTSDARFAVGITTDRSCDIATFAMSVTQNDIIYLRARNVTSARGKVTSARMVVEFVEDG